MKITIILLALLIIASLSSCKDKKEKVELTKQKVEVVKPKPVAAPKPVATPEPEPEVSQENYYVVAGCFDIKSNATNLNSKLLNEGYDSKIIPYYSMSMVTYAGYETLREASNALKQLVQDPDKECAWIYGVK